MELLKRYLLAKEAVDAITPFITAVGRNMSGVRETGKFNADAAFDLANMEKATKEAVKALYALNNEYYNAYETLVD